MGSQPEKAGAETPGIVETTWGNGLEEWLKLMELQDPDVRKAAVTPNWSFPTNSMLKTYLDGISERPESQVKHLLRCFLFDDSNFGRDDSERLWLITAADPAVRQAFLGTEYGRRLLNQRRPTYPGLRWVLDLLPGSPRRALAVIDAYLAAFAMHLPDGRIEGLWDASALISATYLNRPSENGTAALQNLTPRELEQLVARLYTKMGYECELTQPTRDGGRDVIAVRDTPGKRERRLIDCARYTATVPIRKATALLGIVSHEHATSAVLLTTGRISAPTRKLAASNSRLDLVDGARLHELLDEHLGQNWPRMLGYWVQWPPREPDA